MKLGLLFAQNLPYVSEPATHVLYRYFPNLVQLHLSADDYNEYILVGDSCEVSMVDKMGNKLAPNNFIVRIPFFMKKDSIQLSLFDRSKMHEPVRVISFQLTNPPTEVIYLDDKQEGGTCTRRPQKMEARTPDEAPIKLIYEIEYWSFEIGDKEVFGKDGKFDDYAYSVLDQFPSGTEIKFRVRILNEGEFSSYSAATFYLE